MEDILLKLDKGWQLGGIELKPNECKALLQYIQNLQEDYSILQDDYNNLVESKVE